VAEDQPVCVNSGRQGGLGMTALCSVLRQRVPSIGGARLSKLGTSLGFAQRKYTLLTSFVLLSSYTLSRRDE
jgi:hypothetical protein